LECSLFIFGAWGTLVGDFGSTKTSTLTAFLSATFPPRNSNINAKYRSATMKSDSESDIKSGADDGTLAPANVRRRLRKYESHVKDLRRDRAGIIGEIGSRELEQLWPVWTNVVDDIMDMNHLATKYSIPALELRAEDGARKYYDEIMFGIDRSTYDKFSVVFHRMKKLDDLAASARHLEEEKDKARKAELEERENAKLAQDFEDSKIQLKEAMMNVLKHEKAGMTIFTMANDVVFAAHRMHNRGSDQAKDHPRKRNINEGSSDDEGTMEVARKKAKN